MSIIERRVQRLEGQRRERAGRHCAACNDGARSSGPVLRIEGGEQPDQPMPVCAGCGRCNAMVFNMVVAERPAA